MFSTAAIKPMCTYPGLSKLYSAKSRTFTQIIHMKKTAAAVSLLIAITSCHNKKIITDTAFCDSLIQHYQAPATIKDNAAEIEFWGKRISPNTVGYINELQYAGALAGRFHLLGDIRDIKSADSILFSVDSAYNHKEAAPNLSLANHFMQEHRFKEAKGYFLKATAIGLKPYDYYSTSFDVNLELGNYAGAFRDLQAIKKENDYGYHFRESKWEHYNGNMETAISAMQKAIVLAGSNIILQQAALSNTADLYLHDGKLEKANELYMQSLRLNIADWHSLMGIGWIALVHDKNDSLAANIFAFVSTKTKSPDPLFKLVQVAEASNDKALQQKYAAAFEKKVTDTLYGNMYNKYLLDLYTGILNKPAAAEALAKNELNNRATPQTYAWYAYALFSNHKNEEAYAVYKQYVSGKPLEALELYWIGKMMQGMHQGFNAIGYFKSAYKNRYDLSPAKIKDLENMPGI